MFNIKEATKIIEQNLPNWKINSVVDYKDLYLFQVFSDLPNEENFDPFFSVNKQTGEFKDFSILTDGNPNEITELFIKANKGV